MKENLELPLSKKTEEALIEMIKRDGLKPGDRLPTETEMMSLLKVGRSTLREAVKSLSSKNILKTRQGAGIFVSEKQGIQEDPLGLRILDEEEEELALDMNEVRLMVEPQIACLAALHASDAQKDAIIIQCNKVEELVQKNLDYYTEDMNFHKIIAEASGNRVTSQLIPILHCAIGKNIAITNNSLRNDTVIWHRRVAEAIKRGDFLGAKNAMMIHIELNRREISEYLQKMKSRHTE